MRIFPLLLACVPLSSFADFTVTAEQTTAPFMTVWAEGLVTYHIVRFTDCKTAECSQEIHNDRARVSVEPTLLDDQGFDPLGNRVSYESYNINCDGQALSHMAGLNWASKVFNGGMRLQLTDNRIPSKWLPWDENNVSVGINCFDKVNKTYLIYFSNSGGQSKGGPNRLSSCSLNSQNLNLNYSSSSLKAEGLEKSTRLNISCTSGTARNYQLRLTASNATNGLLNFGNGVSAQVSLNGIQVNANGTGISLNNLVNSTIAVNAKLKGSATKSGVSKANGILVLDAL
ncbi:hypothetical protein [Providencia vermicola]|uniref:hypothetical protein n=1 Tax=Providencia vermicola TaxID=333965 RepID=UPI0013A75F05|nr:hypothetical protein [Providencia vermicola]QIC17293.1 hypothetical protein G3341_17115 [Providencia vermicola]